jgi:methionyl-tRNA formyltransferase
MKRPRIVFFGTPEFAVPTLERLHQQWGVCAVVTVPDAPAGRGRRLQPPPVKRAAERLGIETVYQPPVLRDPDFARELAALGADIFCVLAFRILPPVLLSIPSLAFNVHPSLLPKYRGPAPIAHAIIAGERETGITTFILSERVDAGKILLQTPVPLPDGITAGETAELLAPLCAELACQTIEAWCNGTLSPVPQDDTRATAAPKLFPETAWIDWERDARSVRNWIHGHSPEPGAWTLMDGVRLKVYRAHIVDEETAGHMPGQWQIGGQQWLVQCSRGTIALDQVQLPGRRIVDVHQLLHGWRGARAGVFQVPPVAVEQ